MSLKNISDGLTEFAEFASDSLTGRRGFCEKLLGLMALCFIYPRFIHAGPTQYQIVECPPGGPPTPTGTPTQLQTPEGYWWYDPSNGDQYNTPTPAKPTDPPGLKALMNNEGTPECGNAGTPCSDVIDTEDEDCCNCPTDSCPAPLQLSTTGWMSCCGGAEYVYKDCCGKNPSKEGCPSKCYKLPPSTQAVLVECKQGSEAAPVQGWCSSGKDAYCTPGGEKTGKCCVVQS